MPVHKQLKINGGDMKKIIGILIITLILGVTLGVVAYADPLFVEEKRAFKDEIREDNLIVMSTETIWLKPVKIEPATTETLYNILEALVKEYIKNPARKGANVQIYFKVVNDPTDKEYSLFFKHIMFTFVGIDVLSEYILECYNHGAGNDPSRWDVPVYVRHLPRYPTEEDLKNHPYEMAEVIQELHWIEHNLNLTRIMRPYHYIPTPDPKHLQIFAGEDWNGSTSLCDKEILLWYVDMSWYKDKSEWDPADTEMINMYNNTHAQAIKEHKQWVKENIRRKWDGRKLDY